MKSRIKIGEEGISDYRTAVECAKEPYEILLKKKISYAESFIPKAEYNIEEYLRNISEKKIMSLHLKLKIRVRMTQTENTCLI